MRPLCAGLDVLGLEEEVDAVQDLLNAIGGKGADLLREILFIHGIDLSDVDDTPLGQVRFPFLQENVSGTLRPLKVGGQAADDNRVEATPVIDVVLDDYIGMKEAGT